MKQFKFRTNLSILYCKTNKNVQKDLSELTPSSIKKIENLLVLLALFTETMELISPVIKKGMRDMVGKIKSDFEKGIKNDYKFRESVEQKKEKLIEDCKNFSEKIKKGVDKICLPPWLNFWQNQFEEVTFKFRDDQKHYEHVLKNYLKNLLDEYTKPTNTKKFDFLSWADELSKETVNDELVFRITSVFYSKIYDYDYYDKNVELLDSKSLIEFASVCRLEKIGQFEVQKMRLVRNLLSHVDPDGVPTNIEKNGVLHEDFKYILGLLKDVLIVWKDKKVVNTTDIMKRISEIEKENFDVSSGYVQKTNAKRENLAPGSLAGLPKESFGTSSYLRERLCKRKYSTFRDLNEMHAVIMKKAKVEHLRKIIPNCKLLSFVLCFVYFYFKVILKISLYIL